MQREIIGKAIAAALLMAAAVPLSTSPANAKGESVRVMTRNIYQGTNFDEIRAATTPEEFVLAVTATWNHVVATKPDERVEAIVEEIVAEQPDLVSIQEGTLWRAGKTLPATKVRYDQINDIARGLRKLGHPYEVVAIVQGLDAEAPSTLGFDIRVTSRTAILARIDPATGLSNLQIEAFLANGIFPTPAGAIANTRGWASIDVTKGDLKFRFVATHLEAFDAGVQLAQAAELLHTGLRTRLPVVLAGDLNTAANDPSDPFHPTYQLLLDAGLRDAWTEAGSGAGFTCCQAIDLLNPTSQLNQRIDLILLQGGLQVSDVKRVGQKVADRTASGLWPSDHAGVVATVSASASLAAR